MSIERIESKLLKESEWGITPKGMYAEGYLEGIRRALEIVRFELQYKKIERGEPYGKN